MESSRNHFAAVNHFRELWSCWERGCFLSSLFFPFSFLLLHWYCHLQFYVPVFYHNKNLTNLKSSSRIIPTQRSDGSERYLSHHHKGGRWLHRAGEGWITSATKLHNWRASKLQPRANPEHWKKKKKESGNPATNSTFPWGDKVKPHQLISMRYCHGQGL